MDGVVDVLLAHGLVGRQEALMRAEAAQAEAVNKGELFEPLQVGRLLALHLHVEDFDGIESHAGRFLDALLDRQLGIVLESPKGVRGDGDRVSAAGR